MKVLVFIAVLFAFSCVQVILEKGGFRFGAIGAMLFFGLEIWCASKASAYVGSKFSRKSLDRKASSAGMSTIEYVRSNTNKYYREQIEDRYPNLESLESYVTELAKQKVISKSFADVYLEDARSKQ